MAIPVLLFLIALGVRVLTAAVFSEPAYPDAFYYANVAQELAAGNGFSVDFIWNFVEVGGVLPPQGVLPIPSNAHWMPLAAVIQVPFIWLLGTTPIAAGLPFWLIAAAVAPLTFFIARDAGMSVLLATAGGILVAIPGAVSPFMGQPDNFAPFMFLGALALWLAARGMSGHRRSFAFGGVVVGLAVLSRTDGFLLGIPFALAFLHDLIRQPRLSRIGWWPAIICASAFLIVVAPWLLRQLDVFGSLSPSAAGGRILWITEYRELYSVSADTTLQRFLEQGAEAIAASRLGGLVSALVIFSVMPLLVFLVPFVLIGTWQKRRDPAFVPWIVYAVILFVFTALVSAVHVPFGTFLHSAVALIPHAYLLALIGIASTVSLVASRRANWQAVRATRNFVAMAVAVVVVGGIGGTVAISGAWTSERDGREAILAELARTADPADRVMSPDAGAYRYQGGWSGIVTPDDPLSVVGEALALYDVRWLALEKAHITLPLAKILSGEERPGWLSEPVLEVVVASDAGAERTEGDGDELPSAALYAVCLEPSDTRCSS